ncbi:hypothetical protein C5E24_06740 [Pectobacterium parmentieri]|nr:hypothetical protein C5E24_06740 [Pectobacterium parmentieri]
MTMFAYFRNFKSAFSRHQDMTRKQFAVFFLISIFAFFILLALFSGGQFLLVMTLLMNYVTVTYIERSNYFILLLSFLIPFLPVMLHAIKLMKR